MDTGGYAYCLSDATPCAWKIRAFLDDSNRPHIRGQSHIVRAASQYTYVHALKKIAMMQYKRRDAFYGNWHPEKSI